MINLCLDVQISTDYKKIILEFVVLFISLARPDTISPIVGEITRIKRHNFIIKSGMCKRSIRISKCDWPYLYNE